MSFSRVKPSGWAFGEILTSAQQNQLDIDHANAIDGVSGGTYTLAAPLTINTDQVTVEDLRAVQFEVLGTTTTVDVDVAGDLDVTGSVDIAGALDIGTDLDVTGNTSTIGNVAIGGSLAVTGNSRFSVQIGPDSNLTLQAGTVKNFVVVTSISADRTYTLTNTSAQAGDWFVVWNMDGAQSIILNSPAPALIATLTQGMGALLVYASSGWTWLTFNV